MPQHKKELEKMITEPDIDEKFFSQDSELKQVMTNLDSDTVDRDTAMSSIDFNARLNKTEINACLIFDELVRLGILPKNAGLTRQKKRLSVSEGGMGRKEKVEIVRGDRENKNGTTFGDRFKNLFKRQE